MKRVNRQRISLLLVCLLFVQLISGVPQPYIVLSESKREYAPYPQGAVV